MEGRMQASGTVAELTRDSAGSLEQAFLNIIGFSPASTP